MDNQVAAAVHPLAQGLQHQVGTITIDNQTGQKIGLGKNQPAGIRVLDVALSVGDRLRKTPHKKRFIGGLLMRRKHP